MLRDGIELARWPLGAPALDLAAVDEVLRIHLAAKRAGLDVRLDDLDEELAGFLQLLGLRLLDLGGQPEVGEQAGVEEAVDRHDPVA